MIESLLWWWIITGWIVGPLVAIVGVFVAAFFDRVDIAKFLTIGGMGYMLSSIPPLIYSFEKGNQEIRARCEAKGGVAIFGDKGHFNFCADPNYIIDFMETNQ